MFEWIRPPEWINTILRLGFEVGVGEKKDEIQLAILQWQTIVRLRLFRLSGGGSERNASFDLTQIELSILSINLYKFVKQDF